MDFKNKLKNFWRLNAQNAKGFTLVELIVVIAILAILAGVAVPAYSGYVEKANKQADVQLVSEVEQALLLQYYAEPQESLTASVVLSENGATVADSDTLAASAMQAAFGNNWQTAVKLKYDGWGKGVAVTQEVINYFTSIESGSPLYDIFNGNANISYTDNIPELFELMENTAIMIADKRESLGSGANMVTNAAMITNGMSIPEGYVGTAATPAEYFSELWASSAWDSTYLMNGTGAEYNGNTSSYTDTQLTYAIANAGVIKARNVALATYLQELGYYEAGDAISNYTYKDASGNATVVPDDAAAIILKELNGETVTEQEAVFLNTVFSGTDIGGLSSAIIAYYDESAGRSQAYTDGLAYYAMMATVDNLKDSENLDKTNDETWWNDLYSAVDMYSIVANENVNLSDLSELYSSMGVATDNTIVVLLMVQNGVPNVIINPDILNP